MAELDADGLRAKYREERDKRLRGDGNDQYVEVAGTLAHFADDPFVEPGFTRPALADEVDVALVGAGFGGLLTGARLRQRGVSGIRLIEKGGDVGGTWYWNRYPGIACDVESYIYLPLLEELRYVPKEKYSRGAEIFAHCRAIADAFDLYRDACLQTEVTAVRWDDAAARWIVSTKRGDAMRARFVCLANGFLQRPKLPGIPGIETFRGRAFHTSRWDYAYTGGSAEGNLTGLGDKVVGIIGTGATAVQCVPHLGASAKHLYVFQRTPSSVDVRANRPTDPEWAQSLQPGWHQRRMDNFHILTAGGFQEEDQVSDGWTDIFRKLLGMMLSKELAAGADDPMRMMEMADFLKMEQIRARVASIVEDPATAEALKPWYRQFCKRPCFHDEYLQTFNRPNVTLVDTRGKGVERITERGVVVEGREYALDCLVYATGFEVGTDYERRAGYELVGRGGLTLTEKWRDGVRTLHGIHIHGFPNCFMLMSVAQSGFTVNLPYMIDHQARQIAYVIDRALRDGLRTVEVTAEAEAEWVDTIVSRSVISGEFAEQCTPGSYNNEGMPSPESRQNGFFFGGPTEYADILEQWRSDGALRGLECRR